MDFEKVKDAASYIISKTHIRPRIAIILGTGLEGFTEKLSGQVEILYSDIPGFPLSGKGDEKEKMVFGKLGDKYVLVLCSRVHCFEGFSMQEMTFPIWTLKALGIETMIITNAAGAINENYSVGSLVAIVDHIKLCHESPLFGVEKNELGFQYDMSKIYDENLTESLKEVAYGMGLSVEDGIFAYMGGPQYETPAEIRALSVMGADLVGMSTVPEAIVAHYTGIKVLAISCITNYAAGVGDGEIITKEDSKQIREMIKNKFEILMDEVVKRIDY